MATKDQLSWLRAAQRRRNSRENFSTFRSLIEAPGSLSAGVVMPANSRLGISSSLDVEPGALLVSINGVDIGVVGGPADMVFRIGYYEKGKTITALAGAPGTLTLYVLDNWDRPFPIAST